jgi:hypothetical protein
MCALEGRSAPSAKASIRTEGAAREVRPARYMWLEEVSFYPAIWGAPVWRSTVSV